MIAVTARAGSSSLSADSETPDRHDSLSEAIEHAAHLLPAQGPIKVFVHHNTLHAFEDLPFSQAVAEGARLFGCQPYLSEDRYRQYLASGRIRPVDLQEVLEVDLGETGEQSIAGLASRRRIRLTMLTHTLRSAPAAELRWFVAESDALRKLRPEVSDETRVRFVDGTRHWIMRDHRGTTSESASGKESGFAANVANLIERFGGRSIERWTDAIWEAFALQLTWRLCHQGARNHSPRPAAASHGAIRRRQLLLDATGHDIDPQVDEILIRFTGAFLDQGFARWPLPYRDRGYFGAFAAFHRALRSPEPWLRGLKAELQQYEADGCDPSISIARSLELLQVQPAETGAYVTATLLALRGWAGMIRQIETRGDRAVAPIPPGSLTEYLAARLILERLALAHAETARLGPHGSIEEHGRSAARRAARGDASGLEQRAFRVFQLAQLLGWTPADLHRLSNAQWRELVDEIERFSSLERRRVLHSAYERRYRNATLDALTCRARRDAPAQTTPTAPTTAYPTTVHAPDSVRQAGSGDSGIETASERSRSRNSDPGEVRFQVVTCIDDREESLRRHLEEIFPAVETFGAAGFFGVAMYYRGVADAHYVPLCPVVIQPRHYVQEDVIVTFEDTHRRRAATRYALGTASHQVHVGSRTMAGGALLTGIFGPLASVPLVARVLFPRLTGQIKRLAARIVQPPPLTQLELERTATQPGSDAGAIGFSVDEMAAISEKLLRDIGLTERFAPLVIVLGHGSNSLNNPHKSAYDCGACGGGSGGPNARATAEMLNDARVRERLVARGIRVPRETLFVGGFHNTCDDSVSYFDPERLPKSHQQRFGEAFAAIDAACDRNAHERCRRFVSAPLDMTFDEARRHVEGRSEDLAQTRPECGHATNAICVVGRRSRTRSLFLDRRAFLTSYDPTRDSDDDAVLTGILQAVFPVCAGINLEYYFSYVDPSGWGCGTKLPHNVTGLLGVMDGPASDLRTGLPWQMVEIHEPVRLLFIMETHPEALLKIMARNEDAIGKVVRNGWVQFVALDPESNTMKIYRDGVFHPYQPTATQLPSAESSMDWYRGWRDHLEFAEIGHN